MLLKNINLLYVGCLLLILMGSCVVGKHDLKTVNNTDYVKPYDPRYKDNGGKIPTLFFNKGKVQKEAEFMEAQDELRKARIEGGYVGKRKEPEKKVEGFKDSIEIAIDEVSIQIQSEIDNLERNLLAVDPLDDNSHKVILEVLTKLNDLYYKKINPYKIFKEKLVNTLSSDFNFKTGSSQLKQEGVEEVKKLIDKIETEIKDWKEYIDKKDGKIFEHDRFKLVVQINGYADKQGSSDSNLKLSKERAKAVREVFKTELKDISLKYSIVYSINFEGKGEQLPPGVLDSGKDNDPKRRVCVISSVVGPKKLIKVD